jgi:hypothetical protein
MIIDGEFSSDETPLLTLVEIRTTAEFVKAAECFTFAADVAGRDLHSSTFQLTLSRL